MTDNELLKAAKKLRFPKQLEKEFIDRYDTKTVSYGKWVIPMAFIATLSLPLIDVLSFESSLQMVLLIRFLSFAMFPISYLLNSSPRFSRYSQIYNSMNIIIVSTGFYIILAISPPGSFAYNHYYIGTFLLIAVTYTTARLRFFYANIVVFIIFTTYIYVMIFHQQALIDPSTKNILINVSIFLVYFICLCGLTGYFFEYYSRREFVHLKMVKQEKERSKELLLNILPQHITEGLLKEQRTITERHSNVTVLFADLVGFTPFTRTIEPDKLLFYLNQIFTHFDDLTEQYGLEKIKTIGDSYMVASVGAQREKGMDPAKNAARLALDMQSYLAELSKSSNIPLSLRIGINSGPIIAGVIGKKKFTYDLWGDTVNIASRMESEAINGTIQVTESTYHLLADSFQLTERGIIMVKGVGPIKTYILREARDLPKGTHALSQ